MKVLAFSGGKDSMACLHLLLAELDCAIYVDTGYAYPETLALVSYAERHLPVCRVFSSRRSQNAAMGIPSDVVPIDWTVMGQQLTSPKAVTIQSYLGCCYENISGPLMEKAKELGVTHLVSGQRNQEGHKSTARNGTVVDGIVRVHPIEGWTDAEVFAYLRTKMEIPEHYTIEHSSLDCYDCTAYRKHSMDRAEWTRLRHPELYTDYLSKMAALDAALMEAM